MTPAALAPHPAVANRWLNAAEAAAYLAVSENKLREIRTAWSVAHPGKSIEKRLGMRCVRFTTADLDALVAWWAEELGRRSRGESPRLVVHSSLMGIWSRR